MRSVDPYTLVFLVLISRCFACTKIKMRAGNLYRLVILVLKCALLNP